MATYGNGTFTYGWDGAGRQTVVTTPQGTSTTMMYDPVGRLLQRHYANGAVTTQTFDSGGNLSGITNNGPSALVSQLSYAYNNANQRTLQTENDGTVTTWTYDNTYQLLNELRAGGPSGTSFNITHTYDPAGNRTVRNDGTTITTFTYTYANRLTLSQAGTSVTTYINDAAGNRTQMQSSTETTYYGWNAAGQMATAEPTAGMVTFTYNADGQRVAKESTDGSVTGFLYDHKKLLNETDGEGTIESTYASTSDQEYGDLISEDGNQQYYQFDAQANTNAVLDGSGNVQALYKYDAYGNSSAAWVQIEGDAWSSLTTDEWASMTTDQWAALPVDLNVGGLVGMGGQKQYYLDSQTQFYLLGGGNKNGTYYDPNTIRRTSEDPIRQASGDINLYRYVGNNPINNLDPSGHDAVSDLEAHLRDLEARKDYAASQGGKNEQWLWDQVKATKYELNNQEMIVELKKKVGAGGIPMYQLLRDQKIVAGLYELSGHWARGLDGLLRFVQNLRVSDPLSRTAARLNDHNLTSADVDLIAKWYDDSQKGLTGKFNRFMDRPGVDEILGGAMTFALGAAAGGGGSKAEPTRGAGLPENDAAGVPTIESPYQVHIDPATGEPMSIDTSKFASGEPTMNGGIRNPKAFWRQWADKYPDTLSATNKAAVKSGRSPIVDDQWIKAFPEAAPYKGETLVHHHLNYGPRAIPLPESVHARQPGWGIWHPEHGGGSGQ